MLVSCGAIAEGMQRLGWKQRPHAMHELQAAAAVGQMGLVQVYESCFREHGLQTAQVLLTHDDLADRSRYLNARSTLRTLLALGVVPVINENDTVATDEIRFGDNDTLGALVTNLIEADVLVILTDQTGLYTADPRKDPAATLVARSATPATRRSRRWPAARAARIGSGGMITKVLAAKRAARSGAHTVIASGREPDVLMRLAAGERDRHAAASRRPRRSPRASSGSPTTCRSAAASRSTRARCGRWPRDGKSLLPIGVRAVEGEFERGEVVSLLRAGRARDRARPGELRRGRGAPHPAHARRARSRRCSATSTSPSSSTGTTWSSCRDDQLAAQTHAPQARDVGATTGRPVSVDDGAA